MNVKQFARLGGQARAKALTKERREEIARKAGKASAIKRQLASMPTKYAQPENKS